MRGTWSITIGARHAQSSQYTALVKKLDKRGPDVVSRAILVYLLHMSKAQCMLGAWCFAGVKQWLKELE